MDYITPVGTVVGLFLAYFAISREGREDLKSALLRTYSVARKLWGFTAVLMTLLFPLMIMGTSLAAFWQFNFSSDPITRHEVVMLFVHFFNLVMYFCFFLIVYVVIVKARDERKAKNAKRENPTEQKIAE